MAATDRRRSDARHRRAGVGDWDCVCWALAAIAISYLTLALGIYFASHS